MGSVRVPTKETYYALSTPMGVSATATIRISGPKAIDIISKMTNKPVVYFKHGVSKVLSIFNVNNNLVDKVVVVCFEGPNSYTGENMVEIHSHGNPIIVKNVFRCLSALGLRLANPGEFTKTAYLNKKIDLVQAESVFNLINSQTSGGVDISLNNLRGSLSNKLSLIQKSLIYTLSLIEYELDITETDNLKNTQTQVLSSLTETLESTKKLIKTHSTARIISEGLRVVIIGRPNVGKSTLFNALLQYDRSIVTSDPGTTRDVIEAQRNISGFSIVVVDTAGMRQTKNKAEVAGVKKTKSEMNSADIIISMVDSTHAKAVINTPKTTPTILVYNKKDLLSEDQINTNFNNNIDVYISAKTKEGIKDLLGLIEKNIELSLQPREAFYITSKRQEDILMSINKSLTKLSKRSFFELEIFAFEIKRAIDQFDWLLGKTTPDEVLDSVFSRFCVGK
ncbi:MAG: tRNA uridine-5-carboxymethylaminomethyl(34) synthesis GTPase MnmE [Candidatus Marinimicrobia bacterium]|nr:tRNA uridine-5-carboxymethylaminomethyl(34) synthesis GTPase MnmE [Candidatus Neomarinimicrobiota bacterium]